MKASYSILLLNFDFFFFFKQLQWKDACYCGPCHMLSMGGAFREALGKPGSKAMHITEIFMKSTMAPTFKYADHCKGSI